MFYFNSIIYTVKTLYFGDDVVGITVILSNNSVFLYVIKQTRDKLVHLRCCIVYIKVYTSCIITKKTEEIISFTRQIVNFLLPRNVTHGLQRSCVTTFDIDILGV